MTFYVDNLDEAIAHLKTHHILLINAPWQRMEDGLIQGGSITACFRDPDGNLIPLRSENHEGMIYVASIRLMLRKLTRRTRKWAGSS